MTSPPPAAKLEEARKSRTWQRAFTAARKIYVRNHESMGAVWLIHAGWLAGFKAGFDAAKKGKKR